MISSDSLYVHDDSSVAKEARNIQMLLVRDMKYV
jgi:hypothetical protein